MTTRNLVLVRPQSHRPHRRRAPCQAGRRRAGQNLLERASRPGSAGQPARDSIRGISAIAACRNCRWSPIWRLIATPPAGVPALVVASLAARGCRAAVVITAGFGEAGDDGQRRPSGADAGRRPPHRLRIVGPNCLGSDVAGAAAINASFAQLDALGRPLAGVMPSGALVTASSTGPTRADRLLPGWFRSATWPTSISATCWISGARPRPPRRWCSTSKASPMRASSWRRPGRLRPGQAGDGDEGRPQSPRGARAVMSHTGALAGSDGSMTPRSGARVCSGVRTLATVRRDEILSSAARSLLATGSRS